VQKTEKAPNKFTEFLSFVRKPISSTKTDKENEIKENTNLVPFDSVQSKDETKEGKLEEDEGYDYIQR